MNAESIIDNLLADGWREYPSHYRDGTRLFCRSFEYASECKCNQGNRKQVEVYYHLPVSFNDVYLPLPEMFSVEIVGQLPNNEWLKMRVGSLKSIDSIKNQVCIMISAWNHAVSITPNVEDTE